MKAPILVTGAAGFVGANLLRRLTGETDPKQIHLFLRRGLNNWRIQNLLKKVNPHSVDLGNAPAVNRLVREIKPKTVFHLAAHGAYPSQQDDEAEIIRTNIGGTFALMQSCLQAGCGAFVNTGTSSEYGPKRNPMRESDALAPITSYAASKAWATLYGQYQALAQKAPIVTLRLFSVYGAYEPSGRLIPNIILGLLRQETIRLSSPQTVRDFIFIEDAVDAYLAAAARPLKGPVFNVGTGRQTSIREIFDLLSQILKIKTKPVWDKSLRRSFDTSYWVADPGLSRRQLGWQAKTDLRQGLSETAIWFKNNLHLYAG